MAARYLVFALGGIACSDPSAPRVGTVPAQIKLLSVVPATGYATRAVVYPPLVLQVTDESGLPVPGVELGFSGDAYVEPTPANGMGVAVGFVNIENDAGANTGITAIDDVLFEVE